MCLASESSDRGTISDLDDEDLAFELEMALEDWQTLKAKFRVKGFLDFSKGEITLTNWERTQHKKPSDLPEATKIRKQEQRARDNALKEQNVTPVTPLSRDLVTQTRLDETRSDSDLEKIRKDFFFSAENLENSSPEEKKEPDAVANNPEIQETPPPTPAPLRRADSPKIEYADPMGDRFKQSATRRSQIEPLLGNESFISYLKREIKSTEYYKARKVTDGTARDYMRVSYLQNTEGEIRFDKIMDHYTEYQRSQLEATQPTASSDRAPMPERSAVPTHLKNLVKK